MAAEMWYESLLPIYALSFRMRFTASSHPGFFHQGALSAWLRTVLGSPEDYGKHLVSDVLEQGRGRFQAGEAYRFTVFGIGGRGRELLAQLPAAIRAPRNSWDAAMPFRDNWRLEAVEHGSSGEAIPGDPLSLVMDAAMLQAEMAFWRSQQTIRLRIHSPWRVLRDKGRHPGARGELRYCRDAADLREDELWLVRVDDSLRKLAENHGAPPAERPERARIPADVDLYWVNSSYTDAHNRVQTMGGLLGEICIRDAQALSDEELALLLIGQYLGVGQRRVFGNGRYNLIAQDGTCRIIRCPATRWLERAMREDNLQAAWHFIVDAPPEEDCEWGDESQAGENQDSWDRDRMLTMADRLLCGEYLPPAMHGFVHEDADGGLRPLAAAPVSDRVLQRAVHQIITPALDLLMHTGSYAYRAGRSRYQVRDLIQRLHREGYCWVFESDIRSFFDTVAWDKLRVRLQTLLVDSSAVGAIMAWMQAPVLYQGARIERSKGLPQGSPLSPVLANIMLNDFDHDISDAGCRLIRFADDFVIVGKTREQAEKGGEWARKALVDIGLSLNSEKTRVVPFSEGFRFLGFMFVDGVAVECSPVRSKNAGKPPPQSWLASAMGKAGSKAGNMMATESQLRGDAPIPISTLEDRGQVLIFCGAPAMLFTRAGRACIEREDQCLLESPWGHLDGIVLFGRHHITTPAMLEALSNDVPIHLASGSGRYRGMIYNPRCAAAGELWLAQRQLFSRHDSAMQAARSIVDARIRHMRETLRRRQSGTAAAVCHALDSSLREARKAEGREQLNGIEGNATKLYFSALRDMVPEIYAFKGRNRRPPDDPFNALLSFGYTHLYAHMDTLLRAGGLLPELGFYHQSRSGHAALASDLMEPFRHVVERCALSMLQRGKLSPDDFTQLADQGCRMSAAARRVYAARLCEALLAPVTTGGTSLSVLDHMHHQMLGVKLWVGGKSHRFDAWRMR